MTTKIDNITRIPDVYASRPIVQLSETEIQTAINNYVEMLPEVSRTSAPEAEIDDFFRVVHNAVLSRQTSEGVSDDKRLLYMVDSSPLEDEVDTEAITYYLTSRKPGRFERGSAIDAIGSGGVREVCAHQRASMDDPENPGQKLITMGKFYDNVVQFCIYARTDKVAIPRLLWFQRVMSGFNWYFKINGFSKVIEIGCDEREIVKHGEIKLVKYPVSYLVRTDDTFHISTQELRRLTIDVNVSQQ